MSSTVRQVLSDELIGLSAARALTAIFTALEGIAEVYLAECSPLPPLQQRFTLTSSELAVVSRAMDTRSRTGLPFWDAALLELPAAPDALRLLDAVTMHVALRGSERTISRDALLTGEVERACNTFTPTGNSSLTILSEVRMRDGSRRQLPMVDFHAFASMPNQVVVKAVVKKLFPSGALLLESGQSYHAYGITLMNETQFREFLGRALLFSPIIDRSYLAHQLIEGRCALRLTSGGGKSTVPAVISVIQGS